MIETKIDNLGVSVSIDVDPETNEKTWYSLTGGKWYTINGEVDSKTAVNLNEIAKRHIEAGLKIINKK
jgi:hypothetical protein